MRLLRVSLTADSRRNHLLLSRLAKTQRADEEICEVIRREGSLLRTLPAFYNIQIVEGCPQNCGYCPYPGFRSSDLGKHGEMDVGQFAALTDKIAEFSDDAVISVSLWGEAALHSDFSAIAAAVDTHPSLELLVETSGLGWDPTVWHRIRENCRRPPQWIVSLDARSPEVYRRLRGDGYEEAHTAVSELSELYPRGVFVQAVRMKENEEDLEGFYRYWKEQSAEVIIQKYDRFAGRLPDRAVTDLSPLKRMPCWHLKRDLVILMDGTVTMCREDLDRSSVWGNAHSESLEVIWERGQAEYKAHLNGEYPDLCRDCDEYYTFNY
jgi:spiro-SPASM protein